MGQNQIVMSVREKETEVRIKKLFENQKQKFIVSFNKYDLNKIIKIFIKKYLVPGCKYHCLIEGDLQRKSPSIRIFLLINEILMNNFVKGRYYIIKCEYILEDVESPETQVENIMNLPRRKNKSPRNSRNIFEVKRKILLVKNVQ